MKISLESPIMFTSFAEALHMLTNDAWIYTKGIQYDSANGIVKIPMKRLTFIEHKRKGCLLWWKPSYPIYGQEQIDAVLIVRQVMEMETHVHQYFLDRCSSYFPVMMGLEI